jgi:protein-serine/threonine kinase
MSQPKNTKKYIISNPVLQNEPDLEYGRPSISQVPPKFAKVAGFPGGGSETAEPKGHKRSNTVTGRIGSFFGGKSQQSQEKDKPKKYPPVSMTGVVGSDNQRQSIDSTRRSLSFGFGRKKSGSIAGSGGASSHEKPRRFSLLPASFSLKAIGIGKEYGPPSAPSDEQYYGEPHNDSEAYLEGSRAGKEPGNSGMADQAAIGGASYERPYGGLSATPPQNQRYAPPAQSYDGQMSGGRTQYASRNAQFQQSAMPDQSDASLTYYNQTQPPSTAGRYPQRFNTNESDARQSSSRGGRVLLQKNNRKFADAYEQEPIHQNAGSSGAARKVMDFFRRRGKVDLR